MRGQRRPVGTGAYLCFEHAHRAVSGCKVSVQTEEFSALVAKSIYFKGAATPNTHLQTHTFKHPTYKTRSQPARSLGGANLAPPTATTFPQSLDAVLSDMRVWLYSFGLLLLLLSADWIADGSSSGGWSSGSSSDGAFSTVSSSSSRSSSWNAEGLAAAAGKGSSAFLLEAMRPLSALIRAALDLVGLRRLAPRPPTVGVAVLALVAITLLLINAQVVVFLKCACGGTAALALRWGRIAVAAVQRPRGGGGRATPGLHGRAADKEDSDEEEAQYRGNAGAMHDLDGAGCPSALLVAPAAALGACIAGPPKWKLSVDACLPAAARGNAAAVRGEARGAVAALAWEVLVAVAQLVSAAAVSMPHPAVSRFGILVALRLPPCSSAFAVCGCLGC